MLKIIHIIFSIVPLASKHDFTQIFATKLRYNPTYSRRCSELLLRRLDKTVDKRHRVQG